MDWIGLFGSIVILGLVVGLFLWAIKELPLIPDVIRKILYVILIVGAVLDVIGMLTGHASYWWHYRRIE